MISLGHIHLKVSNLKQAEEFYMLLGFKTVEKVEDHYVFMSLGKKHHDLALQGVHDAEKPAEYMTGLYHFALEVQTKKELAAYYKKLIEKGIPVSAVDHGISEALYLEDPDGNGIEIYLDTRNKRKNWEGKSQLLDTNELLGLAENNHS